MSIVTEIRNKTDRCRTEQREKDFADFYKNLSEAREKELEELEEKED